MLRRWCVHWTPLKSPSCYRDEPCLDVFPRCRPSSRRRCRAVDGCSGRWMHGHTATAPGSTTAASAGYWRATRTQGYMPIPAAGYLYCLYSGTSNLWPYAAKGVHRDTQQRARQQHAGAWARRCPAVDNLFDRLLEKPRREGKGRTAAYTSCYAAVVIRRLRA